MDYPESLAYLSRLGNEVLTMKFGLQTIQSLLEALDNPHRSYPSVIIAGTNGKGSVARFLGNILSSSNLKVGLYTSPHLVRVEERFAIANRPIEPEEFAHLLTEVTGAIGRSGISAHPTYFETLTAVAFLHFAGEAIDVAVLEVGMGGRLDSTNVVDPLLSVITPIGHDHQKYLGNSIGQIAAEKAGIIHPGRPVLTSPQLPEAIEVIRQIAGQRGSPLFELDTGEIGYSASPEGLYSLTLPRVSARLKLYGEHQVHNAALAARAAELLAPRFMVSAAAYEQGLSQTELPGRIQRIAENPTVILDGAHNPEAAANLVSYLERHTCPPRSLVFGIMRDKDLRTVAGILAPCFDQVFLCTVDSPRSASITELLEVLPRGTPVSDPHQAVEIARRTAATVVATGSFYLVGQILRKVENNLGL
jgi:dihydrofolate synthase / folylpolyglutamate synthase